jgi:exodeoxyribonuclease VII large subunit
MLQESSNFYSVSELNRAVRALLEDNYSRVCVSGELSNLTQHSSGHWYFSLKDKTAQIRCAMFRRSNQHVKFKVAAGQHVLITASMSLYEARGEYQLIVEEMVLAGVGVLHQTFEALKKKLQNEGLFSAEHKKPLPQHPTCIGVITSPTGAAIRDILTTLKRRFPSIPVIIYPTAVQGTQAAAEISQALAIANQRGECDVLILGRGGGSIEDLWSFNEESVARAIFGSQIPIISAVGHEVDITISDFVADHRAATPTAAAALAVPDRREWLGIIHQHQQRLINRIRHQIDQYQQQCDFLSKQLVDPRKRLAEHKRTLHHLFHALQQAQRHFLHHKKQQLAQLSSQLNTLSPLATLQRGYSIVRDHKQHIVTQAQQVNPGDFIDIQLAHGKLHCSVRESNA